MTLRDDLLPVADLGNELMQAFGLSRFAVTLRRRVWNGTRVGDGVPTNQDIVMNPPPTVDFQSPMARQMEYILASGGSVRDRYYKISDITPRYTNPDGSIGGFTPQQIRMRVGPDLKNVEPIVVLVGDDGMKRECTQVTLDDGDPFAYSMTVQEVDRPSVAVVSIAITPTPATLARPAKLQMVARATFEDGDVADVTSVVKWSSSAPGVAMLDMLGVVTGLSAGTSTIGASIGGVAAPGITLTVT